MSPKVPKATSSHGDVAVAPETAGSAGASVYPRGFSLVFGGWSSSFMHYQKQEQPGGRIISFPCKPTPSCAGNTHPGSSGSCCSQVGEAGLGNLLVPLVLHEGFSERQKKQRKKESQGICKGFLLLSAPLGLAEWCLGRQPSRAVEQDGAGEVFGMQVLNLGEPRAEGPSA